MAIQQFKETQQDEMVRQNIQREVQMLRLLVHPNIVQLKEAFQRQGRIYLVFQYVQKNLLEVLQQKPNGLDPEFIRHIIYQLLKALEFCHRNNVIHRDIKPENLLVNTDGRLQLCDFGFARHLPDGNELLTDYVATRWYRAPELLLSYQQYGKEVDMWAIACIMGELIDGQPLFPGENEIDQLYLIQKLLGPLTNQQKQVYTKNPRFVGMQFPEISKPETLERRYLGKLSKKALSFMKSILQMEPKERINVEQAINHPYFDGIRENNSTTSTGEEKAQSNHNISNNNNNYNGGSVGNSHGLTQTNSEMVPNTLNSMATQPLLNITNNKQKQTSSSSTNHLQTNSKASNEMKKSIQDEKYEREIQSKYEDIPGGQNNQIRQNGTHLNVNSFLKGSKLMQNTVYNYKLGDESNHNNGMGEGKNGPEAMTAQDSRAQQNNVGGGGVSSNMDANSGGFQKNLSLNQFHKTVYNGMGVNGIYQVAHLQDDDQDLMIDTRQDGQFTPAPTTSGIAVPINSHLPQITQIEQQNTQSPNSNSNSKVKLSTNNLNIYSKNNNYQTPTNFANTVKKQKNKNNNNQLQRSQLTSLQPIILAQFAQNQMLYTSTSTNQNMKNNYDNNQPQINNLNLIYNANTYNYNIGSTNTQSNSQIKMPLKKKF